jgi:hypothetical protein
VIDSLRRLMARRSSKLLLIAMAVLLVGGAPLLAGLASAAPNPAGNNGTIKVDREPFDDAPDNQPHVGCTFQVDFYGFDEGDLNADVTFEAQEPTLRATDDQVLLNDPAVFIGQDDNSGGGSEAGLDASKTYTLDLSGITPQPNQGVHVKLTIDADGSQGSGSKYKVFWVTGCEAASTTTTTVGATTTTVGQTTTTTAGASTTTAGETTTTSLGSGVGGQQPTTSSGQGGLPFTGADSLPMVAAGLLLLVVGAGGLLASRRMRA